MTKLATAFESWVKGNQHCGASLHSDKPFAIRVPGSVHGGSFLGIFNSHYRASHLLLMVVFVDGTRAAKVIELPPPGTALPAEINMKMP